MEARINVRGMHCASCATLITDALLEVPGVSKATVSLKRAEANVSFDPKRTDVPALRKAIESEGYEAG